MVRFAALRVLAVGFVFWFPPETKIFGLFEQSTVTTNDHASDRGARRIRKIMRLGTIILIIWLIIGAIAAGQRNYYNHMPSCGGTGTTVITILAGPLNYLGVNPKLSCH